jgi:large subunit ribosomal protein L4
MATQTVNVDLPADIFDVQTNVPLLHQVVVAQLAAARQGTHKTKTRAEVSGAGRKPFKQKGTGRARQGSIRAPHMTGGGIVHGPTPRDYSQRTPKKMKAAALRGALSDRARNGRIHVIESLVGNEKPSTKAAIAALRGISERPNLLFVIERSNDVAALSVRNLADIHTLYVDQLNTYDVLVSDDVIFTKAAYDAFVGAAQAAGITTEEDAK